MNQRTKIGIGIGVGVVTIGIIVVVLLMRDPAPVEQPVESDPVAELPQVQAEPVDAKVPTTENESVELSDQESVQSTARIVVERYGSYSNRNNYENITQLEVYFTERFKQEQLKFIDENQQTGVEDEFYGISTQSVTIELVKFTAAESAVVRVGTRRSESKAGQEELVFTQYARVDFEYVSGLWKVDNITWE